MNNLKDKKMFDDAKRREYLKQQQQLRNMSKPKTNLSADAMIENLLSRKEIFQKKVQNPSNSNQSMEIPPSYLLIWEWSKVPGPVEFADTNKISSLLMTSRLSTETLGYIWSLSNQTLAGSLTQPELFVTLALVALAQSGYSFRSSSVVNQLGRYPVPMLDMSIVTGPSHQPPVLTSAQPNQEDDDEFDDFKSADLSSLNVDNLKVLEVASTSSSTSLIRFDSPKRLPPALSLLDSPSRSSPSELSVLDLPLTETSHQPPFNRQTTQPVDKNSPEQPNPPEKINSISGDISSSPSHVEDLFPKCVVKKTSIDLLDWESPEEYLTCDVSNNKVQIASSVVSSDQFPSDIPSSEPKINISSNNFTLDTLIDSTISDNVSKISLDLPDHQPETIEDKTPDNASFKSEDPGEFDNFKASDSLPNTDPMESSTSGELSLSDLDSKEKSDDSSKVNSIANNFEVTNFLDMDDKYSALRGLEPKANDEFGDFLTAEPVSSDPSTPMFLNQPNIQEQCMEACLKLLNQAICSFETITDEKVLTEVLDDPRCKKYLEELGEVYNVSDRLTKSSEASKREELESIWKNLGKLTRQALPQIRPIHDDGRKGVKCGVCLQESSVDTQVRYAMNHFHSSCANLYLHCVGGASLPLQPLQ